MLSFKEFRNTEKYYTPCLFPYTSQLLKASDTENPNNLGSFTMRTSWKPSGNNTQFIFLLSTTFLFLFCDFVYGDESIKTYWENGNLMNETHYEDEKLE